jgi:hypothetical protein
VGSNESDMTAVDDDLGETWKEVVVVYFKMSDDIFPEVRKKTTKNFKSHYSVPYRASNWGPTYMLFEYICYSVWYEGVSKSFRTGRLEREL